MAQRLDWEQYLQCSPLPDVNNSAALNTCVTQWLEYELDSDPETAMGPLLEQCKIAEQVCLLLDERIAAARQELDPDTVLHCMRYQHAVHRITLAKLDALSWAFLDHAEEYDERAETRDRDKKPGVSLSPCLAGSSGGLRLGLWAHPNERRKEKRVDWPQIGVGINPLPAALQKLRTSFRCIHTIWEHLSWPAPCRQVPDHIMLQLREPAPAPGPGTEEDRGRKGLTLVSVGGVVLVQQMGLPPPSKKIKSWTMRELAAPQLHFIPYPLSSELDQNNAPNPLNLYCRLPDHVFFTGEAPTLGWWDEKTETWQTEGIECKGYKEWSREVEVKLNQLRPFAVVQPRAVDFPYRRFFLRPTLDGCGVLVGVQGSRMEVLLELRGHQARLKAPHHPSLRHLNYPWRNPGELLMLMGRSGLQVTPSDEDALFCRKPLKQPELERRLHHHVASIAPVFEVAGCPFNGSRGEDKAMFAVRVRPCSGAFSAPPPEDASEAWAREEEEHRRRMRELETEEGKKKRLANARTRKPEEDALDDDEAGGPAEETSGESRPDGAPGHEEEATEESPVDEEEPGEVTRAPESPELQWLHVLGTAEKFLLVNATKTKPSEDPLADSVSHASLRRALVSYFHTTVPALVAPPPPPSAPAPAIPPSSAPRPPSSRESTRPTSMQMSAPSPPPFVSALPVGVEDLFSAADASVLQLQNTVRRVLNMLRPFVFY